MFPRRREFEGSGHNLSDTWSSESRLYRSRRAINVTKRERDFKEKTIGEKRGQETPLCSVRRVASGKNDMWRVVSRSVICSVRELLRSNDGNSRGERVLRKS